jgi:hypothetical protein
MAETGELRDRPTAQTAAKLRQDVIARLLARRRILPHHAAAAEEIRAVHEAVGRGMFPTSQALLWSGRGPNRRRARDFLDRMTGRERNAWERRYLPWTHAMATEIVGGLPGTRWLQLVVDIVVDNTTLRQVESRYRLRHGTALVYLTRGLEHYGRFR